ncbi:hypothetical protein SAMN05216232_3082 [Virgibacillus subterraneus]|uniref:DUF2269 family protein n=1 Tax=Virgibacillus subterraneus TaxID=621109 RepID=A0A1H9I8A8_9BACI|nr:hypothetical protein [Virgibacillus subterraneus]SEQ70799.1 hypothetical protein SAMN05216232_3082 [Virgibacillus subterraneus]
MKPLAITPKRWLLSLHLLFAAILFGNSVIFLVLSIAAAATDDVSVLKASYTSMHIMATSSVRASTIGTVVTGILLSVWTKWGLFKFYWIITKEILTIVSIGLGIIGFYFWTLEAFSITAAEGLDSLHNPVFIENRLQFLIGIILQIISLGTMIVISIFKPWGKRKNLRTIKG